MRTVRTLTVVQIEMNKLHVEDRSMNRAHTDQIGEEAGSGDNEAPAGAVEIQGSETGEDPEVGHTPGKAEGVEDPEDQGNE
jgi:hypothetical protein